MDQLLFQKQLKENQKDVDDLYKELKLWGEEMKRKEMEQTSTSKKPKTETKSTPKENNKKPAPKFGTTDYSAWDAFDVDAACKKVDCPTDDDSDLTDEFDSDIKKDADLEKELGNKFVKQGQWEKALDCYTRAISYYSFEPIYYANRALCYLKVNNMEKAAKDCTMSLKLDNKYVKAYQRRAAARTALDDLEGAKSDLEKVLELEPKNKESLKALEDLRHKIATIKGPEPDRPESKFVTSRKQTKKIIVIDLTKSESNQQDNDLIMVKTVKKPVHLRSKAPLIRMEIKEIDEVPQIKEQTAKAPEKHEAFPKPMENSKSIKTDDLKVIEKIEKQIAKEKIIMNEKAVVEKICVTPEEKTVENGKLSEQKPDNFLNEKLQAPKTSVQFNAKWKCLNKMQKYEYLKCIDPSNLNLIFKQSMESDVFDEIIQILGDYFIKNNEKIYEWLLGLSQIKRFNALIMFLSPDELTHLWKLIDYVKTTEKREKGEVDLLIRKFEL